ncbi:hypothetical protein CL689_02325 [Candidatus Saccharibacteria bacterium]|nr:hypothetical protein [Candidatus Saccharibacteria bacterium]
MKSLTGIKENAPSYSRVDQMTPFRPDFVPETISALKEKAAQVYAQSNALAVCAKGLSAKSIERLVTGVSCYYTNVMEGNVTTPIEIERALSESTCGGHSRKLRDLARAHIDASLWAKEKPIKLNLSQLDSWIREAHERLYTQDMDERCEPGSFRNYQVAVGIHEAVDHKAIPQFIEKLDNVYKLNKDKPLESLIDMFCLHHRLMWVHPFGDGNGRVGRLLLQSCLESTIDGANLWSVSRGYARDNAGANYKGALNNADMPRNGDYDGRGNLSTRQLAEFVDFSFDCALDQIGFMRKTLDMDGIKDRVVLALSLLVGAERAAPMAKIFTMCMQNGQMGRGDLLLTTGLPERTARNQLSYLLKTGFLKGVSQKGEVYAALPVPALGYLMPNLYPTAALPALSEVNLIASSDIDGLTRIERAAKGPGI